MAAGLRQVVMALVAGSLTLASMIPASASQRHTTKKSPAKPVQAAPAPPPPPAPTPLTLAQKPASPPQVAYSDGELTIVAKNSTLGDILRAVQSKTGAAMDSPGNVTDRVVGEFGPGPARDVLAKLLNGSQFNYVMLGSETNPQALERVVLISRATTESPPSPGGGEAGPPEPQVRPAFPQQTTPDITEDQADDSSDTDNQPAPQAGPDNAEQQPPNAGPQIKTPEQLLQELQRQQQMQQQQQQQQSGTAQPNGPQQR